MHDNKLDISAPACSGEEDVTTWALPKGAIARLGRGREPDIKFSPDGQYLAIGNSFGLWLYDLATLSPITLWETKRGMVGRVAFSHNGKWIAASNSDRILKVLDVQNGMCLTQIETEDYISGLTFSSDNRYLAAAYARFSTIEIWNPETGELFAKFTSDTKKAGFYSPICFSTDSRLIASTCSSATTDNAESIIVWDMESGEQIACLSEHTNWVTTLCFSPCGRFLASGGEDGTVYVWDVDTWQQVQSYTDYGKVYRIIPSYSQDGILRASIITYDETGPATITVQDLESREQLYTDQVWGNTVQFSDADDWGNTVVFSNGSQLAYEYRHEFINVWTSEHPYRRQFMHSPISFPTSVVFSQDGKTLAVKHHHEGVVLWDVASKRSRPAIEVESAGKNQFVYAPARGKLHVASIKDDNVTLWEADGDGIPLIEVKGRKYWSAFPALSPIGTLFAYADADGNLKIWDVQSGEKLHELIHPLYEDEEDEDDEDDEDKISELAFSPDGSLLTSESRFTPVRLWDMEHGEEIIAFPGDSLGGIIGFSPYGKYLACFGEYVQLWDITRGEMFITSITQDQVTDEFAFSSCGRYLAAGMNEIMLWDIARCELHMQLPLPQGCQLMFPLTFSPCGNYLAAGAWWRQGLDKVPICLWEVETGKHLVTFWGHSTDVQALAISPDNKLLASASYDGTILLWDLTPYL